MSEFEVATAEVRWLRQPLAKPIADATHRIESMDLVVLTLSDAAGREGVGDFAWLRAPQDSAEGTAISEWRDNVSSILAL